MSIRDITISVAEVAFGLRDSFFVRTIVYLKRKEQKIVITSWNICELLTLVSICFDVPLERSSMVDRPPLGAGGTAWAQRRLSSCEDDTCEEDDACVSGSCGRPLCKMVWPWVFALIDCLSRLAIIVAGNEVFIGILELIFAIGESRFGVCKLVFVIGCGFGFGITFGRKKGLEL